MHRWFDRLELGLSGVVMLALSAMVVLIGAQVLARYLFNQPLHWTEELARHLMVWMFFLAAVVALRRGAHLSIDLLPEKLPPAGRLALRLVTAALLAYFFYLMARHGWELTLRTMRQRASALQYPMGYVYAALPVSGLLMFAVNLENALRAVELFHREVREEVTDRVIDEASGEKAPPRGRAEGWADR
ncbi:TRAP transporter small permease [Limnochorda pilosa]|uniref:C4-dicarboxylate ABC transporter permease n=1 Tax=Limnochorda pilosa TaxID=1555112 RepID=A0A0K2SLQ6_LIMPI|nr:TRAP transporter small permease [Limnochorda pilosa]BAS27942.1 C4-dicarboxylate ABC transporter permease [Limnochorda pilosa]